MANVLMFRARESEMPKEAKQYLRPCQRGSGVAPRHRRVLVLLSRGMTFREIASELNIQPITAWQYIEDVMIKNRDLCPKLAAYALAVLDEAHDNAR